jgi:hypothetical protein
MRKLTLLLALFALMFFLVGCTTKEKNTADAAQAEATKKQMAEAHRQIGMPAMVNFQERKLAKMIFELRDQEDLVCYAYLVNKMQGKLVFIGKCMGFGLPYSVQYTNPMRRIGDGIDGEIDTLPQPDPNGLFMPEGLSATWLMMIDPETGTPRPVYIEPEIVVSPFPLHDGVATTDTGDTVALDN